MPGGCCEGPHSPHPSPRLASPHHGPGVCTAVPLCQVPQVDGQLVEPVTAQVPMGQDAVKEGKAQRALALEGLIQKKEVTIWHWGSGPAQC